MAEWLYITDYIWVGRNSKEYHFVQVYSYHIGYSTRLKYWQVRVPYISFSTYKQ